MIRSDDDSLGLTDGDLVPFAENASSLDAAGRFPAEATEMLMRSGLLAAPLPHPLGGRGLGTSPEGGPALANTLRRLGAAWLPLARVFEGHVNAVRLVLRYGTRSQALRLAEAAPRHLFAIWAAESRPVRLDHGVLRGTKSFASAAGVVTRPLITAARDEQEFLILLELPPGRERIVGKPDMLGMGGAGTSAIKLDGIEVTEADVVGGPGDYMRQPEISLGAWRALPGLLGGLEHLVNVTAAELKNRRRDTDPFQLARFGQMVLAAKTAALWVDRVAVAAEADGAGEEAATLVKLARHAVDQACTVILDHARRAAGLASFVRPHPIERLCRDIDTYRRQPALDEVLLEAARYHLGHPDARR